jgi:Tol biopolymer transport system component
MKVTYLLIMVTLLGCRQDRPATVSRGQIESLDISPDDGKLLLLITRDGATTVFETDTSGRSPKQIVKPLEDGIISNPRYSPNGKGIVFIKHLKKSFGESVVCIANRDGTEIQELTQGRELVTEAVFSTKGDDAVYYSCKRYNDSSTKKSERDPGGFDIYAVNLDDKKTTKLTNLNARGIESISEINEKYILFHLTARKKGGGIYSFEKDKPGRALAIFPANGTLESKLMDNPVYSPGSFLMFTAHSELYAMDLTTRKAELIYDAKGGHAIQILRGFHNQSRVLFKKFDAPELTSINADGSGVRSIDVEIPE